MDEFNRRTDRLTSSFALTTVVCVLVLFVVIGFVLWFFATFDYGILASMGIGALSGGIVALVIATFMRALKKQ